MSDLLKEAIADAKAVRETALQNAKLALEEAFTPRIKSMLSAKLREDEFEDEEEVPAEEVPAEDEFGGGEEEGYSEEDEFGGEEEVPAEEVPLEEPELEAPAEEDEFGGEEEIPLDEPAEDEVDETIQLNGNTYRLVREEDEEIPAEEPEFGAEAGEEDDLDLEAVIRELEDEIREEDEAEEDEETVDEQSETSAIGGGDNKVNAADGSDEEDAESGVVVDDTQAAAKALSASGKSVTEDTVYEVADSLLEGEDEDEDDEDTVDEETDMGVVDNNDDSAGALNASGKSVTEELGEYKEAVQFLKDKLHEVNILNAKLLYTNKLFREFILDNGQKMKVVETFDRAQTVREIKLVYATLAESFQGGNVNRRKKMIPESASIKSGSTKPKRKVISEEASVANRFKKLAGLIND